MIKVTILYDNLVIPPNVVVPGKTLYDLEGRHGFSAYIELGEKTVLFDTGWNGIALMKNAKILGKDLSKIDAMVISHAHWDHMGGIPVLLEKFKISEIYLPHGFSNHQTKEIEQMLDDPFIQRIQSYQKLTQISDNIASTGTLKGDPIDEQSLIIRSNVSDEVLLLLGCAHAGLKRPLRIARKKFDHVTTICGGLHSFKNQSLLENYVKIGLKKAYIGHCTQHYDIFENVPEIELKRLYTGFHFKI